MMNHVDAIMTLLQKIYVLLAVILFLIAGSGTVWMGMYVVNNCADDGSESCVGLKATFGLFILGLILSSGYIGRVVWRIYRNRPQTNYYEPLMVYNSNHHYSEEDERVYNV